ncbi:MAG TPA: DUF2723 domain-containing protein [Gemmatimonadaceae bacterium]|nr:DUF2723 domain-containing protein [Gemmatimonadaceae bacterium]
MTPRLRRARARAGWLAGALLLVVYAATLAPDVTFWDAGEFIASAHALGIPHPPGTPLFVLLLHVWAWLLPGVPYAVATNLFSAVVTALAAVLSARLVARGADHVASRRGWYGCAAALCAGAMSTAWLNATETEVYAASLGLAALMLVCADRAGRRDSRNWRVCTAYLILLSVPLHLSALIAAPAAVVLASSTPLRRGIDVRSGTALAGVCVLAAAAGRMSLVLAGIGLMLVLLSPLAPGLARHVFPRAWNSRRTPSPQALLWAAGVALSALFVLVVRARHDPAINQGAPVDFRTLAYVVARKQYDVPGLWPRGVPLWLQIGNLFEYADWQVALSLGPTPVPTVARTTATLIFAALGVIGSLAHHRVDRRRWWALLVLLLCGSVGVAVYLNMKASPSFGWGIIPAGAQREARERDYFFVLGFWVWGLWAGYGAVTLVRRLGGPAVVGAGIAALPILLNWSAVNRRVRPGDELPHQLAEALLGSAPPRAVLFVEGDNDTYPLWYLQEVDGYRRDVTVVTIPLLAADWYQRELSRRHDLIPKLSDGSLAPAGLAEIASRAEALRRPVAAAVSVTSRERNRLGTGWTVRGMVYELQKAEGSVVASSPRPAHPDFQIDTAVTREWSDRIAGWGDHRAPRASTDPIDEYALSLLACPHLALRHDADVAHADSLASLCNRR